MVSKKAVEIAWVLIALVLAFAVISMGDERLGLMLVVVPAVVLYVLTTRLHMFGIDKLDYLAWGVRRRPFVDLMASLAGGFVGNKVALALGITDPRWILLVVVVVILITLYVATVVATPKSALAVINCATEDGSKELDLAKTNDRDPKAPLVWPYVMSARKGGTAVWHVEGEASLDSRLEVKFNKGFTPFGESRTDFGTKVPGTIVAAPILESGSGSYSLVLVRASGREVEIDPAFDVPKV